MKLHYLLPALLLGAAPLTLIPSTSHAFVDVSITVAPPVLPVYEQPLCPTDGYLWTPGYWGYGDEGYFWVPGVWVPPPRVGFLWTPGYWGFNNGLYVFNDGYWGPTVGFYGGVNYGFGYGGYGYGGGRWDGDRFRYNTAITRVNTTVIHNTYIDRSVVHAGGARTSFNGPGGVQARPDAAQLRAAQGEHVPPTGLQASHVDAARGNHQLLASVNHGHPSTLAARSVEGAHGGPAAAPGSGGFRSDGAAQTHAGSPAHTAGSTARTRNDGLSPEERNVVNRRQTALSRPGGDTRETAGRSRDTALRSSGGYPGGAPQRFSDARVKNGPAGPQAAPRQPGKGGGKAEGKSEGKKDKKGDHP